MTVLFNAQEFSQSLHTGFIDFSNPSGVSLRPRLVYNNRQKGHRVLEDIQRELESCTRFDIAVAFITRGGIISLLQTLKDMADRGIHGRILTTDYLSFSEPEALRTLMGFSSIELRVFEGKFHSKGYLFHKRDSTISLIIGSANLTETALSVNEEWNLKVSSAHDGEIIHQVREDFDRMWEHSSSVSNAWLVHYSRIHESIGFRRYRAPDEEAFDLPSPGDTDSAEVPAPNGMQEKALISLQELRDAGESRALLISAAGTGKTYLSAFDVRQYSPGRLLYIAHRETILKSSLKSFKRVFRDGRSLSFGLLTGSDKDIDADFLFANISTLSKPEVLLSMGTHHFDYIIIDEVHRAGAKSYQRVIDYFKPDFLFGMTATPERTDGQDIYGLFDHNVAYNIRLHQALEENMLCPFHYFGISDLTLEGKAVSDVSDFSLLISDERARHIHETIEFYSMHEKRRRGLIFCRRIDETRELSGLLNSMGLRTAALSGSDREDVREEMIDRLESDTREDWLEYILTVDIFNEGVDIPSLNQIIMVRPTQSAIIFVQQLGRGLRIFSGKPYLTVIDFVGSYSNNYLIPVALYGDISYSKDQMRKLMHAGSVPLPGTSTISFDRISRERIYRAIDSASLNTQAFLKERYQYLKVQLGKVPSQMDFIKAGEFDPLLFIKKFGTYIEFIMKVEKETETGLSPEHIQSLRFISRELAEGKWPYELLLLKLLAQGGHGISREEFRKCLFSQYSIEIDDRTLDSVIRVLGNEFYQKGVRTSYGNISYVEYSGAELLASAAFRRLLVRNEYKKEFLDVINMGLSIYQRRYYRGLRRENDFVLYEKYTRKDVCRLLNWENDEHPVIYGYRIKYNTCPIFVTYHKREDIEESTKYEDEFIDTEWFSWMTRSNVRLDSRETKLIMDQRQSGLKISIFVKKSDDEGSDFYYISDAEYVPGKVRQKTIKKKKGCYLPIVNFHFKLHDPVRNDIYTYLTAGNTEMMQQ